MKKLTKHYKHIKFLNYMTMLSVALVVFLIVPGIKKYSKDSVGTNLISVYVNGNLVGTLDDPTKVDSMVIEARRRLAKENEGLILAASDVVIRGSSEIFGTVDSEENITNNIYEVLKSSSVKTKESAYQVKINTFTVNLKSAEEVVTLLRTAKNLYDTADEYTVDLVVDPTRELDVLTTKMEKSDEIEEAKEEDVLFPTAGMTQKFEQFYAEANEYEETGFTLGLIDVDFAENVEVVQTYVDADEISTLEAAISMVTKEEEKDKTYIVESGDTLGAIAEKNGTTIENLIKMNPDRLSSEKSTIRIGDELKVTSPQPELSVLRTEEIYYEESYDAPVQYVNNDEWYTNKQVTLQQPIEGFHKVIADIVYKNKDQISKTIVYEDIVQEPVAKIIERGTKSPPTYLKPISGGRMSSTFGRRKAPKKGASTFHKGIDWAVPTGTAVWAARDGKVVRAGWGSGYGYVVYIQHEDGAVTRYGHLSKILVKSGQSVKQGEKIALSGNTGVSTGPHIHFEILINGGQVNPLNYMN